MSKYLLAIATLTTAFAFVVVADAATYTRDLTIGSTGSDVVALQDMLIASGDLVMPAGVSKGYFGALTKSSLAKWQAANGVSPAAGYFGPVTRAKVEMSGGDTSDNNNDDSSSNNDLSGGDGDIQNISQTTSGTETTLGEAKTEDVLGFDLEADENSDLDVTSVKVQIGVGSDGSTRLTRYLDTVSITLDGDEVGSVDASDFSRDGATSTATIALKDSVVKSGDEARFYVTATANDSINDSDLDNTLNVAVTRVRVEDASGAVLTEDVTTVSDTVDFEDAAANDDARVKSSSATRDAGLLKVDANTSSDEFDILTFDIKVDDQSSDAVITSLPVSLSIDNGSSTGALTVENLIQDLYVEIDGTKYDDYAFNDATVAANATESITATFTIDEGDLEVASGDTVEAVLFVKFAKQSGNYSEGTTVDASVVGSAIDAENPEGDVMVLSGTANGEVQTVQIAAATVEDFSWSVNNTGTIVDFFFTVTAEDENFDVLSASIASTTTGTATTSAGVLSLSTGDADVISGGFEVLDGDTATFRVRYSLTTGTNGLYKEFKITSVAGQEIPTAKQVSPTATVNVN